MRRLERERETGRGDPEPKPKPRLDSIRSEQEKSAAEMLIKLIIIQINGANGRECTARVRKQQRKREGEGGRERSSFINTTFSCVFSRSFFCAHVYFYLLACGA